MTHGDGWGGDALFWGSLFGWVPNVALLLLAVFVCALFAYRRIGDWRVAARYWIGATSAVVGGIMVTIGFFALAMAIEFEWWTSLAIAYVLPWLAWLLFHHYWFVPRNHAAWMHNRG